MKASALAAFVLIGWAAIARAQIADTTLWVTTGDVYSIVAFGGVIYIGGSFSEVGPATGPCAVLDSVTGVARQPYIRAMHDDLGFGDTGYIRAVAPDGRGGLV